jgi:NADH-quinone oxidoreductase subunit J
MEIAFYIAGGIAVFATAMALTRMNAVHALLYLASSVVAAGVVFYTVGAPFVAALELIIYAGAIMVLFIFVVMMLNLGERAIEMERALFAGGAWVGPLILAVVLAAEITYLALRADTGAHAGSMVDSKQLALALYGPYVLGVELASMLLLAGLVGAYHLGWRASPKTESANVSNTDQRRARLGRNLIRAGNDGAASTQERPVPVNVDRGDA